jgi:hypothetical protein
MSERATRKYFRRAARQQEAQRREEIALFDVWCQEQAQRIRQQEAAISSRLRARLEAPGLATDDDMARAQILLDCELEVRK